MKYFLPMIIAFMISQASAASASLSADDEGVEEGLSRSFKRILTLKENAQGREEADLKSHILSEAEANEFMQSFISHTYDQGLVARFIAACPVQKAIAIASGISQPTISRLKNQVKEVPSARKFWTWLQDNRESISSQLGWDGSTVIKVAEDLSLLDLSSMNIAYEDIWEGESTQPFYLVKDLVKYLRNLKGTFISLNLANNILGDKGLKDLVVELINHESLSEFNIKNNMISDKGLKELHPLLGLPNLTLLNISQNYGPSDKTLDDLKSYVPAQNKEKLNIIVE